MRIKQGLILFLIVCIVVAEVSAAKQKNEKGKNGKNEKKVKSGKYEGKEGKQHGKNEHKHSGKHGHTKEEAMEEEVTIEEEEPAIDESAKVEEKKASKKGEKLGKEGKVKNEKKSKKNEKEATSGTCDCPPGPAGPPGPPGPAGECIYQPVCPESAAIDSNPSSCSATAGESCACGKDCACNKENIYSESANIGTEPSHIFLTKPAGIIAIHSQSTLIPACPLGQNKLWEGFSLMRIETNGQSSNFDLGSSGSCVRSFMPSVSATCDIEGQCKSGQRNDRTYWLLANGTVGSEPMTQEVARGIVSRCVVCDVPSAIVAIHSQSIEIPKCPAGWDDMWFGYSYLDSSLGEQNLAQAGSCLKEFKNPLFIECNPNKDSCNLLESHKSSWLIAEKATAADPVEAVVKETVEKIEAVIKQETGTAIPETSIDISRCSVCIKVTV